MATEAGPSPLSPAVPFTADPAQDGDAMFASMTPTKSSSPMRPPSKIASPGAMNGKPRNQAEAKRPVAASASLETPPTNPHKTPTKQSNASAWKDPDTPQAPINYGATDLYWTRLRALIEDAQAATAELRPTDSLRPLPELLRRGQVAALLQGVPFLECMAVLDGAAGDDVCKSEYASILDTGAAGQFVEYGIPEMHAAWAHLRLMQHATGETSPISETDLNAVPDEHVQQLRIRVFESELACLPTEFVERLLVTRKTLRKIRSRVETCVRILLAMEGRGRRVAEASLDKMKLALEKADRQAHTEQAKLLAAEEARLAKKRKAEEKECLRLERESKQGSSKRPVTTEEKRKRLKQQNAQASFMQRFVRVKSIGGDMRDEATVISKSVTPLPMPEKQKRGKTVAVRPAKDRDVMSVSWWLLSELETDELDELDRVLRAGIMENDIFDAQSWKSHIVHCAQRRKHAESRLNFILKEYRRSRKERLLDRNPRFVRNRKHCRGELKVGPVKLLHFHEDYRPGFFGNKQCKSSTVKARRPFVKDIMVDYDYDSEAEWDEEADAEDLEEIGGDDQERAAEDAELRKIYGSDADEDDDDFEEDEDLGDDDDVEDELADENGTVGHKPDTASDISSDVQEVTANVKPVVDLTHPDDDSVRKVNDGKRPSKDVNRRLLKRRKTISQNVTIEGPSVPLDDTPSSLDRFSVTLLAGAPRIEMFNPFVYDTSVIAAEHLKQKPPPATRPPRSIMDDKAKLDLAVALVKGGSSRDRIIFQFCETRRIKGLVVPSKSEILRTIAEMATREKRDGDTRAGWYLNDANLTIEVERLAHVPSSES